MNWYKKAQQEKLINYIKSKNISYDFYHGTSEYCYKLILKKGSITSPHSMLTWKDKPEGKWMAKGNWSENEPPRLKKEELDKVYYTHSFEYASYFATRTAKQVSKEIGIEDHPVVLELKIQIHYIEELMTPLLNYIKYEDKDDQIAIENAHAQFGGAEGGLTAEMAGYLQCYDYNRDYTKIKSIVEEFMNNVKEQYGTSDFTTKLTVPIRFIQKVHKL